jgi:hypothetical protein
MIKPITAKAVVRKIRGVINPKDIYHNTEAVFLRITEEEMLIPVLITPILEKIISQKRNKSDEKNGLVIKLKGKKLKEWNEAWKKDEAIEKGKQAKDKRTSKKTVGRGEANRKA